jgi:hypothetical protein
VTIALDNVGTDDFVLKLGAMYGFGKKQVPQAIRLVFTDSQGKKRTLPLPRSISQIDEKLGALSLPLVVPLSTGGRHMISCDLADYSVKDVGATLAPGHYRVQAKFVGQAVTKQETGTGTLSYLASMPYWTGTVTSDDIQITLPAKPAR